MIVETKFFGTIELPDEKILTFERGLMGFEDYKKYTILYDSEKEGGANISWLQSVENKEIALPVISPVIIKEDYNPIVEDELLTDLGELTEENLVILLVMTVPTDLRKMSVNMKAPIIINADTCRGEQMIVQNEDYEIKYNVYEVLESKKEA